MTIVLSVVLVLSLLNTLALVALSYVYYQKSNLKEEKKKLQNQGADLSDFMSDLKIHGYGVVRLDPDNLIYRTPRVR
jgi:hypothetical protein